MTHSGSTARMVSRYRPAARIIAMTPFPEICRQLSIVWGITPFLVKNYKNADYITNEVGTALKNRELIIEGEKFVITGGVPIGSPGTTNYLSVLKP